MADPPDLQHYEIGRGQHGKGARKMQFAFGKMRKNAECASYRSQDEAQPAIDDRHGPFDPASGFGKQSLVIATLMFRRTRPGAPRLRGQAVAFSRVWL